MISRPTQLIVAAAIICFSAQLEAAPQSSRLLDTEISRSVKLPYLLFVPSNYNEDPNRRWPLLLYLHGGSARGSEIDKIRTLGLPKRLDSDPAFPFIVVSPLAAEGEIWTDVEALDALLTSVQQTHRIDSNGIYVTGHSMGGRGALYMAYKYPRRFAGVVAMSPLAPITAWASRLHKVPLWIIHGARDVQAPIKDTEELLAAIEKAGGKPRFTRLDDRDHFILDQYEGPALIDWLTSQRKVAAPPLASPSP